MPLQLQKYPLSNPPHHRHGLAVAQGSIARAVGAFFCWRTAPRDQCVVIREPLQALALTRGEATNFIGNHGCSVALANRSASALQCT